MKQDINISRDDIVCIMRNAGFFTEPEADSFFEGSMDQEAYELFIKANTDYPEDPVYYNVV